MVSRSSTICALAPAVSAESPASWNIFFMCSTKRATRLHALGVGLEVVFAIRQREAALSESGDRAVGILGVRARAEIEEHADADAVQARQFVDHVRAALSIALMRLSSGLIGSRPRLLMVAVSMQAAKASPILASSGLRLAVTTRRPEEYRAGPSRCGCSIP